MSIHWSREAGYPRVPSPAQLLPAWEQGRWATSAPYETERAVMWALVAKLGFVLNVDFTYQKRLPVRGINQTGLNRSDFWVLSGGRGARYGVGAWPYYRGRVLNPISAFTHRSRAKDVFERDIIRQQARIDVIYLDMVPLLANPVRLVELALQGTDISSHR